VWLLTPRSMSEGRLALAGLGSIRLTSAIIIWQSNVPLPPGFLGRSTCGRIFDTTGGPNVMLGTKWPSICAFEGTANVSDLYSKSSGRTNGGVCLWKRPVPMPVPVLVSVPLLFPGFRTLLPLPRARKTYNIDVKPIAALAHCLCALMAELGKVGAQDRGRYDRGRAHRGV
jgi:hypothetical protein